MPATLWTDLRYNLPDEAHMAQKLRVSEDDIEDFSLIYQTCARIAAPKFLWREARVESVEGDDVQIEGVRFHGRVLAVNLRGAKKVYPYVSTCGRELYDYAKEQPDPLTRYWVDMISEQALLLSGIDARKRLFEAVGEPRLYSMNPGSLPGWPISQQRPLFDLIGDVRERAGVELRESFLMLPEKSGSGLYFASEEEYTNCEYCARGDCPRRRAPFQQGKFEEKFGG